MGLTDLFEVPGDYASTFLEILDDYQDIRRIPNINELGTGYAADGYGRFKGVAACSVQYGVGTFSILNCFAGSLVERVPMVLIGPSPSNDDVRLARTEGILFHHSTGNPRADQLAMDVATVASAEVAGPCASAGTNRRGAHGNADEQSAGLHRSAPGCVRCRVR